MAVKFLDKTGLGYFWGKIKAWCNSTFAAIAHTHTSYATKHSYTTAANAAKNWYRIANASTQQLDTSKPIRAQFIVTAYNTSYAADYYETWFVNAIVFGRTAHIVVFGGSGVPFSQARILYENTVANIDANDRPAIDLYLNYVLPNGTTKIEVEEIYNNGGWTFVTDGQLAASTIPSGFESIASAPRNNGVNNASNADYATYLNRQISNITAAFTLADSYLYRSRTLNCTGTFTITVPSINSGYMWCVIKNKNTSSGVITLHPSTTSVLIDGSNADITLQPMEYVCIHSAGANNYSLIADGRWKSQKADKGTTLFDYGITDAKIANGTITLGSNSITPLTSHQTLPTLSRTISGSGNAITDITVSNHAITATKGSTFLTSASTLDATKLSGTIPSGCYTNTTYTAGTGLSLSGTQFSLASHNQASNTINAMTGYSKPSSTSAITTSDTLNQAIGKLEKAIDDADINNVVHLTGDETIQGIKTFRNDSADNISAKIILRTDTVTKGTNPETTSYISLPFCDNNTIEWDSNSNDPDNTTTGRLGLVETQVSSTGITSIGLYAYKNALNTASHAWLTISYNPTDDTCYAICPSTLESRTNGTDILTRDWIPKDTRIVHTTGNETILDSKIFSNCRIAYQKSALTKGTAYNTTQYYNIPFGDSEGVNAVNRFGCFETVVFTNKDVKTTVSAFKNEYNSGDSADLGVYYPVSEDPYVYANCKIRLTNHAFSTRSTSITKGTAPSSDQYVTSYYVVDNNSKTFGALYSTFNTDKVSFFGLLSYDFTSANSTNYTTLGIVWDSSGNCYGRCPTPPSTSDNSAKIATTAWVTNADCVVHKSGAETITGVKTFSNAIICNYHALKKADATGDLTITGGTATGATDGGKLVLTGKSASSDAGYAVLHGGAGSSYRQVIVKPDDITFNTTTCTFANNSQVGFKRLNKPDGNFVIFAGSQNFDGANLILNGRTYDSSNSNNGKFYLRASTKSSSSSSGNDRVLSGVPNGSLYWNGQAIQTSSDERLKRDFHLVDDNILDKWELIDWLQFRFKDAVEEKGNNARLHVGLVSQWVDKTFTDVGLDVKKYGIVCHEYQEDHYVDNKVIDMAEYTDEKGVFHEEVSHIEKEFIPGTDEWTIRYTEALCMEAAYQRRKNKILENRISELEKQVSDMLQILQNLTSNNG